MSLVQVRSATKYFGAEEIFREVSLSIDPGARIGIVGKNGEGKTTLLRLISGHLLPDAGEVERFGEVTVDILDQDPSFSPGSRIFQVAREPFAELSALEKRLRRLEEEISSEADDGRRERLLSRYGSLMTRFEDRGGYGADARVREALLGLGFASDDLRRTVDHLSGGEKVRLALARLLLSEPGVMLLDEPTNHLDFASAEWLEEYLADCGSAVLAVSHDRYFLDRLMNEIWEVHGGRVERYGGNYSDYRRKRREYRRRWQKLYEQQREEIEKLEGFIRRYHAGQRSREAQSRQKRLDHMERIEAPPADDGGINLSFPVARRSGREVLRVDGLTLRKGDTCLCRDVDLRVHRGERIALMGPNGSGKTTGLRALLGLEEPEAGTIVWGTGTKTAFFPQDLSGPDDGKTVLEELYSHRSELGLSGARQYLARFGFSGDDVFTRVADLSGGERSRLVLAEIALEGASVLVLDEPTNHLDLQSLRDLEGALSDYRGTVIFVSHDRFFVDRIATRLWILAEGRWEEYAGTYSEYRRSRHSRESGAASATTSGERDDTGRRERKTRRPRSAPAASPADLQDVEGQIEELEREHERLAEQLADPDSYARGGGGDLARRFHAVRDRLRDLYRRWEELAAALEERQSSS